ncbi:hypothetical protein M405DRAFT_811246, partial [Rhizopogon salebrosus TDB-379]
MPASSLLPVNEPLVYVVTHTRHDILRLPLVTTLLPDLSRFPCPSLSAANPDL